jgi:putative endopeptidase
MKLLNYIYVPILILFQFSLVLSAEKSSKIPDQRLFPISTKYAPCEDFHKYVCDEVESSFKLREDRNRHAFAFNDSAERILTAKKKFFSQISKEKNLSDRSLQIKNYYLACMDQKSGSLQEKAYLKKLTTELSNIQTIPDFFTLQLQNIKKRSWQSHSIRNRVQSGPSRNCRFVFINTTDEFTRAQLL